MAARERRARYLDWARFTAPARPSAGVTAIVARALRGPPTTALLLGCTPEFRTVCHRAGHALTVVDHDPEIYRTVSPLVEVPGPERFLRQDWHELALVPPCAVALGDGAVNMVETSRQRSFFEAVRRSLLPGGRFLLHAHFPSERVYDSPEAVFRWWRENVGTGLFLHTWYPLSHFYRDPEPEGWVFDYGRMYDGLEALAAEGAITPGEWEEYRTLLGRHPLRIHFCTLGRLARDIEGLFELEAEEYADDYPGAEAHPVLFLRALG